MHRSFLVLIAFAAIRVLSAVADRRVVDPSRVIKLSWRPRAFLYKGFLSYEECEHLITLAKDKLEKSMVADNESGKGVMSEVRTSSGMFLEKRQDETIARIEQRIATWTFLPEENGEAMQVLHYEHGEKYEPHFDYFHDKINQQLGGHRVATVLMYLSNVQKGGETVFPDPEGKLSQQKDDSWSDCAKDGYAEHYFGSKVFSITFTRNGMCRYSILEYRRDFPLKPQKGDALLFFSLHPNATTDPKSLHGGCPVGEGEKWSATKWIHVRSFESQEVKGLSKACEDANVLCPKWAAVGECTKNPLYMVGSEDSLGFCRKSCNVCAL